jgi:hypothetical protein
MSFRRWQKLSERMTENVVLIAGAAARGDVHPPMIAAVAGRRARRRAYPIVSIDSALRRPIRSSGALPSRWTM